MEVRRVLYHAERDEAARRPHEFSQIAEQISDAEHQRERLHQALERSTMAEICHHRVGDIRLARDDRGAKFFEVGAPLGQRWWPFPKKGRALQGKKFT